MTAETQANGTLYFPGPITEGDRIRLVRFLNHHWKETQVTWLGDGLKVILSPDLPPIRIPDRDAFVKAVGGMALGLFWRWKDQIRGVV